MLFRDMKNLRWTKNHRISCNCNTWKKIKTWSEDLSSPAQQLVTPGSQHSLQTCLLPPCVPGTSSQQLSGHADALLLATWVQIFPSHSSWCGYYSTGSAQRAQGTRNHPCPRWGYHNHQTPCREALNDNVIVLPKNISFWSFGTSKQVFCLLSESGLWLRTHLFSLVTHAQCLWPDLPARGAIPS